MITFVYGPPASGKTVNKDVLKRHFGARRVVDSFPDPDSPKLKDGDLVLTCMPPSYIEPLVQGKAFKAVAIGTLRSVPGFTNVKKAH